MSTPRELAQTYFDSWAAGDADALRAILADDATFNGPLGTAADADACVKGLMGLAQITEEIKVIERTASDTDVITWFELHTTQADQPLEVANWSHVEAGKISRIRVTFDPRPLTRQR